MSTFFNTIIEVHELTLAATDSYLLTYINTYAAIPQIVATAVDDNVNVYIDQVGLTYASIRTSHALPSLKVHVQIIGYP